MLQIVLCNEVIRSFKRHLTSAQWLQDAVSRAASGPTLTDLTDSEECSISFFIMLMAAPPRLAAVITLSPRYLSIFTSPLFTFFLVFFDGLLG